MKKFAIVTSSTSYNTRLIQLIKHYSFINKQSRVSDWKWFWQSKSYTKNKLATHATKLSQMHNKKYNSAITDLNELSASYCLFLRTTIYKEIITPVCVNQLSNNMTSWQATWSPRLAQMSLPWQQGLAPQHFAQFHWIGHPQKPPIVGQNISGLSVIQAQL